MKRGDSAGSRLLPFFLVLLAGLAAAQPPSGGRSMNFALMTQAFAPGGDIPRRYTCDGEDLSPGLQWTGKPSAETKGFALIADDPDAPVGTFTHWVLYDLPASATSLPEGVPKQPEISGGGKQGRNDFGKTGFGGPCPPPGKPHRYYFRLYALDAPLSLKAGATRAELEGAMGGHVVAQAEVMGRYKR